nr:immunoglobulin heavy chain junction region [Macaca mulatta]MOV49992.1 immunoglobulin heavy chain junction region [Macaca mulatta]
CARGIFDFW